jgi:hypothetical protein
MSSRVSLSAVAEELDSLTDEERAALRASWFHSASIAPAPDCHSRFGTSRRTIDYKQGNSTTVAKFLKRKLQ